MKITFTFTFTFIFATLFLLLSIFCHRHNDPFGAGLYCGGSICMYNIWWSEQRLKHTALIKLFERGKNEL